MGCGTIKLKVLMAMYNVTISALHYNYIYRRSVTRFTYIMFSFVLFVGVLIRVSKEGHREESFLKWLHVLTLMDDTVILATSRETLIKNHRYLLVFCSMAVNESKSIDFASFTVKCCDRLHLA